MTVVRRARPTELDAVGRLTVAAYLADGVVPADAPYLGFLADAAARDADAEVWVAVDGTDDGRLLGTVTYVVAGTPLAEVSGPGEAEIRTLAVDPASRGSGVGALLTRAALERAAADGCHRLVLSSSTTMHAAHRLYERLGFVRDPGRDWSPVPDVRLVAYAIDLTA